jgi:OmpA-OmpF porin, OOP family
MGLPSRTRLSARIGASLLLAAALLIPDARAQFYLGPEAGWTGLPSYQTDKFAGSAIPEIDVRFNDGFNAGVRGGYEWGPWRFEEEYSYRENGVANRIGVAGISIPGVSGDRHTNSIMTNLLYDFTPGWPITPHFGVGVGAVQVFDGLRVPGVGQLLNDSIWQFGYQGIAGLRYIFDPVLALDLDYRYFATTQPTFSVPNTGLHYRSSYKTNNFVASLTYRFGPPPSPPAAPPPPPAAAPPAIRPAYLVFFDWDKYNITPEGTQIIQLAANQYRSGGSVRLQVTGYTDLSGSAGFNQRLSERRAAAVAAALERLGVPRSDMAVTGRGANDPRVPTPPGVREPQNRRVEIVFP